MQPSSPHIVGPAWMPFKGRYDGEFHHVLHVINRKDEVHRATSKQTNEKRRLLTEIECGVIMQEKRYISNGQLLPMEEVETLLDCVVAVSTTGPAGVGNRLTNGH
mmetsp:Transcript_16559/g.27522  ORF Transcript_16559/g.27522 Transcript_16559/m.27522 type:complete len:105 (+) Transcript_16559:564-878(+)